MADPSVPDSNADVAILARALIEGIDCNDFKSCRKAFQSISELKFGVYRNMVDKYDPSDPDGFRFILQFFSTFFSDKKEAASEFAITVSTFYRWKSGESCPHALVRAAVREKIIVYLSTKCPLYDDLSGQLRSSSTMH